MIRSERDSHQMRPLRRLAAVAAALVTLTTGAATSWAAEQATGGVSGIVVDQLGAELAATVSLLQGSESVAETPSDATGAFEFDGLAPGRYRVEARADGFTPAVSAPIFVGGGATTSVSLSLAVGPIEQYVVVTASATDVPQSQSGSPVSVVSGATLEQLAKPDVLEAIRLVPATNVVQTGGRGGTSSILIRGGASTFNKVLIDGVPANDIGGSFDWDAIATTGVERVEVLRSANSVLYGSDALSGVISLTTPRGDTTTPQLTYSLDGGNLGTVRNELSVGGLAGRVDYFADVSQFDTDNEVPNNEYDNTTGVGRFGVLLGAATDLSVTVRRIDTDSGSPNGVLFYGIPDDSSQTNDLLYVGATARSQVTNRLQTDIQFGSIDHTYSFVNPSPTGEPFDPFGFGANYLGDEVTVVGGNGFETTGRAILDFGGSYPSIFDAKTTRRFISGQVDYYVNSSLDVSGGVRVEREEGTSGATATTERNNVGSFVEARVSGGNLVFVTGGVGFENNGLFGYATTPRISVALYARPPLASDTRAFGDTKVTFNAGEGIKAPSVFSEQSQLFTLISDLPDGGDLINQFGIEPIGPERSRNIDIGIEQTLAGGRARARVIYFDNEFTDLVEFVNNAVLPQLGVPPEIASAVPFGASVNASSYTARGVETSADIRVGNLQVMGSYTVLDSEVTDSFSGGALNPAFNPAFPDIEIGQFTPLVGARPFGRPRNVGRALVSYFRGPAQVSLAAFFVGKSDGSTFLSDAFFGTSMLLPNEDLNDRYQKVDLSGSYRVHPRVRWYVSVENLLDQQYVAVPGFPSLGATFRTGASVTLGGD